MLNESIQIIINSMCKSDIEFLVNQPDVSCEEDYQRIDSDQFADEAMDN